VGRHEEKLEIARQMGLDARLESSTEPEPADIVVEATGSPLGIEAAMLVVRPRGTIVLKSTVTGSAAVDLSPLVVKEITVIGSRCGPFDRALGALASGEIDVRPLITHRFPLAQALAAVRKAGEPGVLKVLLEMEG
jgi:threonine dehydrogenase-like Zn-dependent dehydrogenase